MKKKVIRYSEAFKLQMLQDLSSVREVSAMYGIRGANTVKNWALKFGRDDLLRKGAFQLPV